jgi:RNA polymerase sigma-70 factor, ECF subfamily
MEPLRATIPTPVDDPDAALIARAQAGDIEAFGVLVERHRDVVLRVARRIVGPDEADDVAQDALLRAFHRLGSFRGDAPFRAWLLRIAHNTALNAVARKRPEPVDHTEHEVVDDGGEPRRPADALERAERAERLERKLLGLSVAHRTVLVLRDVEGLSYEEIAELTDAPLGSVKGRLHRARAELAEMLRRNTYDWGVR